MNHILVAVDGSRHSLKAVDFAANLAEKFRAKVTFIHVVQEFKVPAGFRQYAKPGPRGVGLSSVSLEKIGRLILDQAEKRVAGRKLKTARILVTGAAPEQIAKVADQHEVDLIVMGSRGLGPIRGFVLGSVSTRVLFRGSRPVLIVK
jgi:nucleotide-binding universal stress UspA family protein